MGEIVIATESMALVRENEKRKIPIFDLRNRCRLLWKVPSVDFFMFSRIHNRHLRDGSQRKWVCCHGIKRLEEKKKNRNLVPYIWLEKQVSSAMKCPVSRFFMYSRIRNWHLRDGSQRKWVCCRLEKKKKHKKISSLCLTYAIGSSCYWKCLQVFF